MKNLVSIIVPVYNVEQYLNRCVESIINQTYKNLEIILIDDGSPDNCPQMCDLWEQKDSRIKVIHKKNGGLSSARNAGLRKAKGDYVLFVDSDDWISLNMVESMLTEMIKNDTDMVICQFSLAYPNGKIVEPKITYKKRNLNVKDTLILLLQDKQITNHVWRKLYKRSLLPKDLFPINMNYEDAYVMSSLFLNCKKILYLDDAYYYYFQNDAGIVRTINYKNCSDHYYALENCYSNILKKYPELVDKVNDAKRHNNCDIIVTLMHVKDKIPEARKLMKEIVKENIKLTKNCKLGIREYMLYHFFSYFPNLYIICGKLNIKIRKYKTELLNIKTKK